jgi:hypothetical protein
MVTDFRWSRDALSKLRVGLHSPTATMSPVAIKLQPFEVIVAAVFAKLRPDYEWWVTPNRSDRGLDFLGRGVFLTSKELGINAAITIGGQCKKRSPRKDLVNELAGSFVKMARTHRPTFFVAAFAAAINPQRIAEAKEDLEHELRRHCHILDRFQIEKLIGANLHAVKPIIRQAFGRKDADYLLNYFAQQCGSKPQLDILIVGPSSVLTGESFRVRLTITRQSIVGDSFRINWSPSTPQAAMLVAPLGADSEEGFEFTFQTETNNDPFIVERDLEFVIYAVGSQPLGSISIRAVESTSEDSTLAELPTVDVVENLRPPFYDVPYREPFDELERGLLRAGAGRVASVAIVGAGGAGKTRLCEEMCLESRRRGAQVVSARQAHTTEFPRRILANLLWALTDEGQPNPNTTDRVVDLLGKLEPRLAQRALPAIEALCGQAGKPGSFEDDQSLLSVLALLITQKSRSQTVIIHLHDLHWCTFDVLLVIDRLIWQLDQLRVKITSNAAPTGIRALFLLEGRMHEFRKEAETGWSTLVFERFIERLSCPIARCRAFLPHESAQFAQRLFEQGHSAARMLSETFRDLQRELIDTVHRVAGGNPLHMLEQVKLLQQHGILAQNSQTGLIYMVRPDFRHIPLPATVFKTIEARWRYYEKTDKRLALLLWAAALVDDNLPTPLFRHLWTQIAPAISQAQLESTEFLRFPQSDTEGLQISFRHENYFQTIRGIQVADRGRRAVVDAYSDWFGKAKRLSAALLYVQAKVLLEAPHTDLKRVEVILRRAQRVAVRRRDKSLMSRILATLLDGVTWPSDQEQQLSLTALLDACDDEITLCDHLIHSGRSDVAYDRIQRTVHLVDTRISHFYSAAGCAVNSLRQRRYALLAMKAGILFHDRRPVEAVMVTEAAVTELEALLAGLSERALQKWNEVLMEIYDTHSAAIALSGDLKRAVTVARKAAEIAQMALTKSPDAIGVVITYANILLCQAPEQSESILKRLSLLAGRYSISDETRLRLDVNLSMARLILGYKERQSADGIESARLNEAYETLLGVFREAHALGRLPDAAAAALLLGLIRVLWNKSDDIDWFSQSVAIALRARQLETLWRSYINLAHSLYRSGQEPHDAAAAAIDLMEFSLSSSSDTDNSPRFALLSVPMAHATRYLILAKDKKVSKVLRKFPALRRMFSSLESGELRDDRDGRLSHEWLRVGEADYVIF